MANPEGFVGQLYSLVTSSIASSYTRAKDYILNTPQSEPRGRTRQHTGHNQDNNYSHHRPPSRHDIPQRHEYTRERMPPRDPSARISFDEDRSRPGIPAERFPRQLTDRSRTMRVVRPRAIRTSRPRHSSHSPVGHTRERPLEEPTRRPRQPHAPVRDLAEERLGFRAEATPARRDSRRSPASEPGPPSSRREWASYANVKPYSTGSHRSHSPPPRSDLYARFAERPYTAQRRDRDASTTSRETTQNYKIDETIQNAINEGRLSVNRHSRHSSLERRELHGRRNGSSERNGHSRSTVSRSRDRRTPRPDARSRDTLERRSRAGPPVRDTMPLKPFDWRDSRDAEPRETRSYSSNRLRSRDRETIPSPRSTPHNLIDLTSRRPASNLSSRRLATSTLSSSSYDNARPRSPALSSTSSSDKRRREYSPNPKGSPPKRRRVSFGHGSTSVTQPRRVSSPSKATKEDFEKQLNRANDYNLTPSRKNSRRVSKVGTTMEPVSLSLTTTSSAGADNDAYSTPSSRALTVPTHDSEARRWLKDYARERADNGQERSVPLHIEAPPAAEKVVKPAEDSATPATKAAKDLDRLQLWGRVGGNHTERRRYYDERQEIVRSSMRTEKWGDNYVTFSEKLRLQQEERDKQLDAEVEKLRAAEPPVPSWTRVKLRPLTSQQKERLQDILEHDNSRHMFSTIGTLEMTVHDIQCIRWEGNGGPLWLNDEVINFYMKLLQGRSWRNWDRHKCAFMNTFFYPKLSGGSHGEYRYSNVKRWTKGNKWKKIVDGKCKNIFALDKLIFPVHVGKMHWCCGVVNFKDKRIEYYDSMGGAARNFFRNMRQYLRDESKDKCKQPFDDSGWVEQAQYRNDSENTIPQQENGSDCGVFAIKFADFLSEDRPLEFKQEHMTYFRQRIACDIIEMECKD